MTMDQIAKRGRGRPPHPDGALSNAARQRIFARQRKRDTAELAYALKDALGVEAARAAFANRYRDLPSGARLRRVLATLLTDDPETMAFFDAMIALDNGKCTDGGAGREAEVRRRIPKQGKAAS
jgi:hypothetical protein